MMGEHIDKSMDVQKKNMVLIGMRGAGKTSVGAILASKLRRDLIEMDTLIVDEAGMAIPQLVEEYGWDYFRAIESLVTERVSQLEGTVNSTGGGVVLNHQNVLLLRSNGIVFWLDVSVDNILQRIDKEPNRPLLTQKATMREEIESVLAHRKALYHEAAHESIDTNGKQAEQVADEILNVLQTDYDVNE
jgi:shikimate kinase